MRMKEIVQAFLVVGTIVVCSAKASAENDVALGFFGAFTGTTTGNGTQQSPSNAAGGLIELRHISNPLIGYEGTYSYNRANQSYKPLVCPAPVGSPNCGSFASVSANAHEITGDWIASVKIANLRPFALAGLGVMFDEPVSAKGVTAVATSSSTQAVYVYGAGLDWGLVPHIGLRLQYRGNLYKAPNLTTLFTSTNAFTHTAEPMIGAYFRF
jgi:opacity protein-like surface antigen